MTIPVGGECTTCGSKQPAHKYQLEFLTRGIMEACAILGNVEKEQHRSMGLISRAMDEIIDPLPTWVKGILGLLVLIGFIYGLIHEGFWFLLRVLFAPDF